jgi:hypothetical protein
LTKDASRRYDHRAVSVTPALDVLTPPTTSTGGIAQFVTGARGARVFLTHRSRDGVEALGHVDPCDTWVRARSTASGG